VVVLILTGRSRAWCQRRHPDRNRSQISA
jgi:hypothetical protein